MQALRRHPHCNAECCLSVIMMINDAAEDVTGYEYNSDEDEDEQIEQEEHHDPKKQE